MKTLFFCFNQIHFIQYKYLLKNVLSKDDLLLAAPMNYSSDFDIECNPGDFKEIIKSNMIFSLLNFIKQNNISTIFISDVNFNLFNLLASSVSKVGYEVKIQFYYDGLANIIDEKMTPTDKFKDIIKYVIAKLYKLKYSIRSHYRNGKDLDKFSQYCTRKIQSLGKAALIEEFGDKIINRAPKNKNLIIYISQEQPQNTRNYNVFLTNSLNALAKQYPDYEILVLDRPSSVKFRLEEFNYIDRLSDVEPAESVCIRLEPSIIVSTTSTTLINMKLLNTRSKLICFDLVTFCKVFKENDYGAHKRGFLENNIDILTPEAYSNL
jgi:hypothetical protein